MTGTDELTEDLTAIDGWLQRNAPTSHRTLRPGLDHAQLAALNTRYGFPLHPDLQTLLSWHDGCTHKALAFQIWTDFIFEESAFMYEETQDFPPDFWDPHWVPIATDLGLKMIIIDHKPPAGRVMLFDGVDGMYEKPISPSLGSMISRVRQALEKSAPLNGRRAAVSDGALNWPEIPALPPR
ncbi:SMI1/KNR4 family protein [Paractinoplanes durhamensis]|uniref:SMI1/KNR4 family protein n=1 Tax=Paractinoplanes durhamensis TaxID=113563 RepID=UPI0019433592|nr:SMI1/KNR4 family protein [Actinoplanes durhamensis]